MSIREDLEFTAKIHGWTITEEGKYHSIFQRKPFTVNIGWDYCEETPFVKWCALFQGLEPCSRYGLGDPGPETAYNGENGEMVGEVADKERIIRLWLEEPW